MKKQHKAESKKDEQKAGTGGGSKTELVKAPNTAVSTAVIDFAADEGADRDSFAIPFLAILQPMSPQVVDGEIEGAKAGLFINSVDLTLMESPMVIPCAFQRRWIRWTPRETGGGYKGEITTAEVNDLRTKGLVKELDGRLYFPEPDGSVNPKKCDRLADTRSHFVLIVDGPHAEVGTPAVFALTSTGIKASKNWLSRIESVKLKVGERVLPAPSFSRVYQLASLKKQNDKGTWWTPEVSPVGEVANTGLYAQAKAFHASVTAGSVQVAHDTIDESAVSGGGGEGGSSERF